MEAKQSKKQTVQVTANLLGKSAVQGRTLGPSNLVSVQEMELGIDDTTFPRAFKGYEAWKHPKH